MKSNNIAHAFEINLGDRLIPTAVIAVFQSMNTLPSGDVLKVSTCNKNAAMELILFCKKSGNTLLLKKHVDDVVTLFIKKG